MNRNHSLVPRAIVVGSLLLIIYGIDLSDGTRGVVVFAGWAAGVADGIWCGRP
jgi:hypothetical protein